MQLDNFLLILLILFIIPIFILFSEPNVFFIIISFFLLLESIRSINRIVFGPVNDSDNDEIDEISEELESISNIDLKKLFNYIKFSMNLVFIILLIYSSYYLKNIILKDICLLIIIYRILIIRSLYKGFNYSFNNNLLSKLKGLSVLLCSSMTIVLITIVSFNKFIKLYF